MCNEAWLFLKSIYPSQGHCINSSPFLWNWAMQMLSLFWSGLPDGEQNTCSLKPFQFQSMKLFCSLKKIITLTILKINNWINSPTSKSIGKMTKTIVTIPLWFTLVEIYNYDWGLILFCVQKVLSSPLKFTFSQIHELVFMFLQFPLFLLSHICISLTYLHILAFQNSLNVFPTWWPLLLSFPFNTQSILKSKKQQSQLRYSCL